MGLLVDGIWTDQWYDTKSTEGRFERPKSSLRNWVTKDGSAGITGVSGYKAEANRYHLYVSLACPWAHRTLIFRKLKGLESFIDISVVHWLMEENGWTFEEGPGVIADNVNSAKFMHQVYTRAMPNFTGRVTVPVLWDKKTSTIVSNESSDIIQMFNSSFDSVGASTGNYFPAELVTEMDAVNDRIYNSLNNGVYKCGFATSQKAYQDALFPLFETMDWMEDRLSRVRYLLGNKITASDWRVFPTLCRFDAVYHAHFKCSKKRLIDYPNLWDFTRDLYQIPGVADTFDMDHARKHYYLSHTQINPTAILPALPSNADFSIPHTRLKHYNGKP
jgi:glutathionyl-hydroquinone reductase